MPVAADRCPPLLLQTLCQNLPFVSLLSWRLTFCHMLMPVLRFVVIGKDEGQSKACPNSLRGGSQLLEGIFEVEGLMAENQSVRNLTLLLTL